MPGLAKLTNTEPFAAWFVVTGDATADGIRVVRSVLGAIRVDDAYMRALACFVRARTFAGNTGY